MPSLLNSSNNEMEILKMVKYLRKALTLKLSIEYKGRPTDDSRRSPDD